MRSVAGMRVGSLNDKFNDLCTVAGTCICSSGVWFDVDVPSPVCMLDPPVGSLTLMFRRRCERYILRCMV